MVHAVLSAVSDCAMVRVMNGMQEVRTEEDSLELRQAGRISGGGLIVLALGIKFAC